MWYAIAAVLGIVVDQLTKLLTVQRLELGQSVPFIPGVLHFNHVRNYGASWNILDGKRWFLIVITVVAILVIAFIVAKRVVKHPLCVWGLIGMISGGVGNLLDRIMQGYVVDMFEPAFIPFFPVFNVADIWATVGVIVFAVGLLFFEDKNKKKEELE